MVCLRIEALENRNMDEYERLVHFQDNSKQKGATGDKG